MDNRFNLIDEPWIPVAGIGRVSLRQLFEHTEYRSLGGNPVQRIALLKLLLAIAQAASTPEDERQWHALGSAGLAHKCLDYLQRWHECFYLYGERPFLQMPAIAKAAVQRYGAVLPEISTGNTTVLNHGQLERPLEDADKALLLVCLMGFALAGKKTDNAVVLTPGYAGKRNGKGKPSSSKPGPAVAHMGLLHSFLLTDNLLQSLWLNLLTDRQVQQAAVFTQGMGVAPWEQMPTGEDCPVAQKLRHSLIGRLVPLSRFCLLSESGLHYSEGLAHANYKEGICDPSVAVNQTGKEPKALWADPDKRPWRELTSLLGFIQQGNTQGFQSLQLRAGLDRVRDITDAFAICSAGLRVSSNAGEQYASGTDDFVESQVWLKSAMLGEDWFLQFKAEMDALGELAKSLYGRVIAYFKEQTVDGSKQAAQATHLFWQLSERHVQQLVDACDPDHASAALRSQLRKTFAARVQQAYDHFCPKETARQMDAWATSRPNNSKYLHQEA